MITNSEEKLEKIPIILKNNLLNFMKSELLILPLSLYLYYITYFISSKLIAFFISNIVLILFILFHYFFNEKAVKIVKNHNFFNLQTISFLIFSVLWTFLIISDTFLSGDRFVLSGIFYSFIFLVSYFFICFDFKLNKNDKDICIYLILFLYLISVSFDFQIRSKGPLHNINGSAILIPIILYMLKAKNIFWMISFSLVILCFKSLAGLICLVLLWLNTEEFKKIFKKIKKLGLDYYIIILSLALILFVSFFHELPRDADFVRIMNYENAFSWISQISAVGGLQAGSSGNHFGAFTINLESSLLSAFFEYSIAGLLIIGLPLLLGQFYLGFVIIFISFVSGIIYSPVFLFFMILAIVTSKKNKEVFNG